MLDLSRTDIARLHALIEGAERITLVAHTRPDGDAIGSTLALSAFLQARGKDAAVLLPDRVDDNLRFMLRDGEPLIYTDDPDAACRRIAGSDLLFCLDCNAWNRTAGMEGALARSTARKVLIDHHIGPDTAAFDLCFSRTEISSASELLYWILLSLPGMDGQAAKLPPASARALLTGMTTDTNNFANSVYPSTFEMAGELIAAGVDREGILACLYNNYPERRFRLMGHLLRDCMTITPEGIAYMILRKADRNAYGITEGDTEGFVNLPLGIDRVRMSLFLKEEDGLFRVSIRSRKELSANQLARTFFHGGGHAQAAGGRLCWPEDIPHPDAAEPWLLRTLASFLS